MLVNRGIAVAVTVALASSGCATSSTKISAVYVSPMQYSSYDCMQLAAEASRIQSRVVQLGGRLDEAAKNDAGIMAVGLILFWPVLFALGGTKEQEAEYGRLKGEYDAVQQAAISKKCAGQVPTTTATSEPQPPATTTPVQESSPIVPVAATSPPPLAPPPIVPVALAVAPVTKAVPVSGDSKYMFSAEQYAKANGCAQPLATMVVRQSFNETFSIDCQGSETVMIRCEGGACRSMR
jgi:hypothetical protein